MPPSSRIIDIYTDGSCHTQHRIGAWASLLFTGQEKIVLTGNEADTTHNRMELTAVIKAIEYISKNFKGVAILNIFSDSQYVVGLTGRKEKLSAHQFITKKGNDIQNADLVKALLSLTECFEIEFIKVKAHQKKDETVNYNIEVDKLSRKLVREAVIQLKQI